MNHTTGQLTERIPKKESAVISTTIRQEARKTRRSRRGQSLVEFALSVPILLLLLFGMIDLGRAFFTLIALDSVISEGAHWAAAYPECIASAANATDAPQVPPPCKGTNSIIGRMLNESTNLDMSHVIATTVTPTTALPGDTITITISYRLDMITPVVQAIAGNSIVLTAQGREVVRNSGMPARTGVPMSSNGGVSPTNPISDAHQTWTSPGAGPSATCNNGVATLAWTAVSATGYHIFLGHVTSPFPAATYTITPSAAVGSTMTQTHTISTTGAGGTQEFTLTSYNDDGVTVTDSPATFVTVTCSQIIPTINPQPNGWWCPDSTHAAFAWTMPAPIDTYVTGYAIYKVNGATNVLMGTVSGISAAYSLLGVTTAEKTMPYFIQAMNGGSTIGSPSPTVTINCLSGTGLRGDYYTYTWGSGNWYPAPIRLTRTDTMVNFSWGTGSPDVSLPSDNFSVQWTGKVQALCSDTYTFYTDSDDGVRLWVNGVLVINNWTDHPSTQDSGTIVLEQGKRYDITLNYYEHLTNAVIKLSWSSTIPGCPGPTKTIIPQSQLYP